MFPKNARSGASAGLALAALLLALAPAVRAGEKDELHASVVVEQDYDSNIFSLPSNDKNLKGSPLTVVRPSLGWENNGTLGSISLDGWLKSRTYWDESGLSGVDRGMSGSFDRTLLPRFSVFGDGSYMRLAPHADIFSPAEITSGSGGTGTPNTPVIVPGQLIEGAAPNVDLAQGEFGGRYQLTPRSKLTLSGGPFSLDYLASSVGRSDLRDRDGWFTKLSLTHDLSYLDQLSFDLAANSTNIANAILGTVPVNDPFDPHTVQPNTGTDISNQQSFSVAWDRTWDELWSTHVEIGVRRLESQTKNALRAVTRVGPPPTGTGDSVPFRDFVSTDFDAVGPGVIGGLTIRRVLPRGRVQLSYMRETRTSSSTFNSDVNVDDVSLSYVHNLSQRASVTIAGTWEHYVTVNDAPIFTGATYVKNSFNPITGPSFQCATGSLTIIGSGVNKAGQCQTSARSALQSDAIYASARLDWQLRKRLSTFVSVQYIDRTGDVLLFGFPFDKFIVGVGFSWDYSLGY